MLSNSTKADYEDIMGGYDYIRFAKYDLTIIIGYCQAKNEENKNIFLYFLWRMLNNSMAYQNEKYKNIKI